MRMPRPPPPKEAFSRTGYPTSPAIRVASSTPDTPDSVPGRIGTPAPRMMRRASALSPMLRMLSGGGPMNVTRQASQTSASAWLSARNP